MTWSTHALFGVNSVWLLAWLPPEILGCDVGTLAATAALGVLLPDLDALESKIKHLNASKMHKIQVVLGVVVQARDYTPEVLQPSKQSLDFTTALIAM